MLRILFIILIVVTMYFLVGYKVYKNYENNEYESDGIPVLVKTTMGCICNLLYTTLFCLALMLVVMSVRGCI